jgi:hypothetical protein
MILKAKADYVPPEGACPPGGRIYHKVTLPHNSLFVLGWRSNRDFLHSIRSDKRMASLKSSDEILYGEQRISLTFRTIATFIRPLVPFASLGEEREVKGDGKGGEWVIVGQGARKHKVGVGASIGVDGGGAGGEIEGEEDDALAQSLQMLTAFGAENKTARFHWNEHYGRGFDIVNFSFTNNNTAHQDSEI